MGRWVYAERRCGQCQKPLDGRSDQRYCSSTCRSAASRSHRAQYAAAVLDMLNRDYWQRGIDAANTPGRHTALAASARDAAWAGLLEITNYNGPKWRARAEQVHMRRPDVWNELTGSVILAAARPRTIGACRWCDALSRAAMADEVIIPDAATAKLLGNRCDQCAALVASVTTSGSGPRPGATTSAPARGADLARSTTPKAGTVHAAGCVICAAARFAAEHRKSRANANDRELRYLAGRGRTPHQPLPGPEITGLYKSYAGQWQTRTNPERRA